MLYLSTLTLRGTPISLLVWASGEIISETLNILTGNPANQFWNSWHITLAQWFRAYYFNPLTRALRTSPRQIPMPWIIFFGQVSTMLLLGLWHGITWNFAIWGAWHGIGLFIHNRWSELIRSRQTALEESPWLKKMLEVSGVVLTFNYVALGWVWFALSQPVLSWQVLLNLFSFTGGS
jgi:D-alanyl-lipoteichoic acid acyltransferase DltB (MBOAT superfamily)